MAMEAKENATRLTIGIVVICVLAGIHLIFAGALGAVTVNKKWPKVVAGVNQGYNVMTEIIWYYKYND